MLVQRPNHCDRHPMGTCNSYIHRTSPKPSATAALPPMPPLFHPRAPLPVDRAAPGPAPHDPAPVSIPERVGTPGPQFLAPIDTLGHSPILSPHVSTSSNPELDPSLGSSPMVFATLSLAL
ncbi:hypothetical protein LZ30DRAFT_736652 [Colletotrichum cereale]|nr:hypothetical protein LZ30DRAFT_736652 [Colletotrichum cereale]